ncbi:hypothetical protein [Kribbella sp. NPDC050470]|uniref:hypothetical protein n=1 Tax=unclassified Kribbella TaxID=2644121 RepID=UPI0037A70715
MAESGSTDMDIPGEAVEAAARALAYVSIAPHSPDLTSDAHSILAAAFPHLRPLFQHAAEVGRELGRREALNELYDEVSMAEEWQVDDPRISYVDVQIDKSLYLRIMASRASGASSEPLTGAPTATGDTEEAK